MSTLPANSRQMTAHVRHTKRFYNGRRMVYLNKPRHVVICELCEYTQAAASNAQHAEEIRIRHLKTAHFRELVQGVATIYFGEGSQP